MMMSPCRDVLVRSDAHSQRGPVTDSLRHPVLARLASRQCILPLGPIPSFLEDLVASAQSGTLYRGREGMWSWVAHRISGMLIFLFLLVHVLDTALVRVSPEAYNEVIGHYKTVVFGLGEVGLVGAVVSFIVRSYDDDIDYYVQPDEIARIEQAHRQTKANAVVQA